MDKQHEYQEILEKSNYLKTGNGSLETKAKATLNLLKYRKWNDPLVVNEWYSVMGVDDMISKEYIHQQNYSKEQIS